MIPQNLRAIHLSPGKTPKATVLATADLGNQIRKLVRADMLEEVRVRTFILSEGGDGILLVDEEARLRKDLPPRNDFASALAGQEILGEAVIVTRNGDEWGSLSVLDLEHITKMGIVFYDEMPERVAIALEGKKTEREKLEDRIRDALFLFIPEHPACLGGHRSSLPKEITNRILPANLCSMVALRDRILDILSDYRSHSQAEGRLATHAQRSDCATAILRCF